ncbi:hypothetical protein, conserved [Perkinsus marinus ATCC 50983]|uniref:Uncharacterized protein n=1 Tax=Perkinsus marinus (strain ATCC 50983 / TXsc) TaxID=423536 RepID=C5LAD3_PERM5|nr:hypothetical protein, conserved [Perkinsus marinus ATCC 50983]EER06389.1 hypothetical protein, conserved [Perkinsus marinus ATCC 50983]|eukprot:XP_002774573.1 hypothetical protein, conserved [Perkinsus marinus ATCC 50983]
MAMLDASLGSGAETGLTEWRNFHDVTYTREKRIECIHWVPEEPDVVAASYLDNLTYGQRLETMGKPRPSCILLWSFHNPLSPHAALLSPSEVVTFSFCPTDRRFVVGGLITGQMVLWRVTDQELGVTAAKRGKVARKKREKEGHDKGDVEKSKEKVKTVMTTTKNKPALEIKHKLVSTIDDSHKRACRSIAWLPHWLDVERKGKCVDNRSTLEGEEETVEKAKFFVTVAGDGQVFLWDFQSARDAVVRGEHDFTWRPIHSVQLQRQDSGTEMGCTHILPLASMNLTQKAQENRESNFLSNFFATTEEGEVIFGDWAAVGSAEKKPELVKSLCEVSKTFRPLLELRESHRMSDLMLAVSDWEFSLWYIGGSAPSLTRPRRANMDEEEEEGDEVETARPVKSLADRIREPIFRSAAPSNYFACGACSPSRPAVLYLGRVDGSVDVWDFTDQSHQPLMSFPVTAAGLTSMTFCPEGKSLMAVGDDHGHLHVLRLPVNLVWGPDREEEIVRQILDHAYHNLDGVPERKKMLEALKQQNEKDTTTGDEETVVLTDSMVDEEYKKTLAEFCEAAGIPQASSSEAPPM